jgi:hypothetical protein
MKFSTHPDELKVQVVEILQECTASQRDRENFYKGCRNQYLFGSTAASQAKVNKIKPTVDLESALVYAPESIQFWVNLPPDEDDPSNFDRIEPVIDSINDQWHDTGLDMIAADAVTWGFVNGCSIVSVLPEAHVVDKEGKEEVSFVAHLINPASFGVYNEYQPDMLKQEAVVMTSLLTRSQIEYRFRKNPRVNEFVFQEGDSETKGQGVVFVSSATSTTAQGFASPFSGGQFPYSPESGSKQLFRLHDVYAWDDDRGDYRLFQMTDTDILFDAPIGDVGIPGRLPFIKICPRPLPNYFWGYSLVDALSPCQEWYMQRMNQIDKLWEKTLKPPKVVYGSTQLGEEKEAALNRPGGYGYFSQKGMSEVQELKVEIPDSSFMMMDNLNHFFLEMSGLNESMQGKQAAGNRTEQMASGTLRVSAAQVRRIALTIEPQLEDAASLLWRYIQRYSDIRLPEVDGQTGQPNGKTFLPADFPEHAKVKIDGHSASPLYVEDHAQLAQGLMRYGAIDQETLIRLMRPPLMGWMEHKLKRIQFSKLVAQAMQQQQEEAKRQGKMAAGEKP